MAKRQASRETYRGNYLLALKYSLTILGRYDLASSRVLDSSIGDSVLFTISGKRVKATITAIDADHVVMQLADEVLSIMPLIALLFTETDE